MSRAKANLRFEMGNPWLKLDYGDSQETRRFDPDYQGIVPMGLSSDVDLEMVLQAYESAQSGMPVELG